MTALSVYGGGNGDTASFLRFAGNRELEKEKEKEETELASRDGSNFTAGRDNS